MKKVILVAFSLFFVFFAVKSVKAEEVNFLQTYDTYSTANSEYLLARSQYIQSGTLASRQKAQEATYKMLQARDEVVKTYLADIRQRLSAAQGVSQDRRDVLNTRIDKEVTWFDTHKNNSSSAASLEDLVNDSNLAKTQYDSFTEALIYEVLSEMALGKEYFLRQQQLTVIDNLKNKISEIKVEGDFQTDNIERNILEVENRLTRSEVKEQDARKIFLQFEKSKSRSSVYSQVIFRLNESIQYLKEANTYLKEIINQIKVK